MATYYVDRNHPAARDSNAGTASSPWLTIQRAADMARPGDTIYVKAGIYKPFEVESSGAPGNHIVFSAYPGHEHDVIIDGTGVDTRGLIEARGKSHFTIKGFRLQDADDDGIHIEGSEAGSRDILISNNQIANTGNSGIYAAGLVMGQTIGVNEYRLFNVTIQNNEVTRTNVPDGQNEAITLGGGTDGFVIRNNWVHHTDQFGIDVKLGARNGVISGNLVHDIEKHGIYLDSASRTIENVKIFNNTVYEAANGIVLARESVRTPKVPNINNIDIYDNLVHHNDMSGIVAYKHIWDVGTGKFNDVAINSNTVYGNGVNGVRVVTIEDFASNFVISNNTVFGHNQNINNDIGARESGNIVSTGTLKVNAADGAGGNPLSGAAASTALLAAPAESSTPTESATAPAATEPAEFEAHFNVGGGALTTADDIVFRSAPKASGTLVLRDKDVAVNGTQDDALYQSYGFGDEFGFAIAVPKDGTYRVELHLAEMFHTAPGERVFDVSLEGNVPPQFNNIDVYARAGGQNDAATIAAEVKVTDGTLNLEADNIVDQALINGFSIYYDSPL